LKITQNNDEKVSVTFDWQVVETLYIWDEIKITNYKSQLQFIRLPGENFYKTIRNKLHWGKGNI
jgi:NAD kinase